MKSNMNNEFAVLMRQENGCAVFSVASIATASERTLYCSVGGAWKLSP